MSDFSYDIKESIAILSEKNGYTKELNLISYGGRPAKYDIRDWYTDEDGNKKMMKGITLSKEEAKELLEALSGEELED